MWKDIITTCRAAALALSRAPAESADAALGSALRDPALDAKPVGTPSCKSAGGIARPEPRNARSIPAARIAALENLRVHTLGAGPRARLQCQLTLVVAHNSAADTVVPAHAGILVHAPSDEIAGSLASAASAELLPGTIRCNTALADDLARTAVRSP